MNNERYSKTNPIKANSPVSFRIPASVLGYIAASAKLTALAAPGGPQNRGFSPNFRDTAGLARSLHIFLIEM